MRGLLQTLPVTGPLWLAGFLAIAGSPPFGLFVSELMILKGALQQGQTAVAVGYLLLLGVVFVAMARIVLRMAYGSPAGIAVDPERSRGAWAVVPPMALGAAVLALGLCLPDWLQSALTEAAAAAGSPVMPQRPPDPQRPAGAAGGLPAVHRRMPSRKS